MFHVQKTKMSLNERKLEDNSIHDDGTVQLNDETFVLATEHEILQTIVNEDDESLMVNPYIITSCGENVRPLSYVLLNVSKSDDNEFRGDVNDLIDFISTEGEGDNNREIQDCEDIEMNDLPKFDNSIESDKEKFNKTTQECTKISLIQVEEGEQMIGLQPEEQDAVLCQSGNIILDNFVEKVIVTQYKCKCCTLKFNTPQEVQTHFLSQHLKFQSNGDTTLDDSNRIEITHSNDSVDPLESLATNQTANKSSISKPKRPISKGKRFGGSNRKYPCDWPQCDYVARHKVCH